MCLAILFHQHFTDTPLALAANREEAYDRPALPPHWWDDRPVFAGRDERAGGTWLGLNCSGLLAALTNRAPSQARGNLPGASPPHTAQPGATGSGVAASPTPLATAPPRSRGHLCADALAHPTAREALAWARAHLAAQTYDPFNLLLADGSSAWVVHWDGQARVQELPPGVHYLAETDVDDPAHPRIAAARPLVDARLTQTWAGSLPQLRPLMGLHQPDLPERQRMCRHLGRSGTVSSSLVALPARAPSGRVPSAGVPSADGTQAGDLAPPDLRAATYEYAPGPPCRTVFEDRGNHLRKAP